MSKRAKMALLASVPCAILVGLFAAAFNLPPLGAACLALAGAFGVNLVFNPPEAQWRKPHDRRPGP